VKVIKTEKYLRKTAQVLYDPDNREEPLDLYDAKTFDIETEIETELPIVTPEDALAKRVEEDEEVEDVQQPEPAEDYPTFPSAFLAMRWAKQNNKTVWIEYKCRSGRVITRNVEPHGDFYARTTHRRIFVTFDEQVNDIRSFIGQNILNYVFTGDDFKPKFNFSIERRNYKRRLRYRRNRLPL